MIPADVIRRTRPPGCARVATGTGNIALIAVAAGMILEQGRETETHARIAPPAAADIIEQAVVVKSVALFVAAALADIGGAYLVWTAVKTAGGYSLVSSV